MEHENQSRKADKAKAKAADQPAIQYHGTVTGRWPPKGGMATHTVYPTKYMVAVGDWAEGFQFYGPFTEDKYAARWAYNNLKRGTTYRVCPMFDVRDGS